MRILASIPACHINHVQYRQWVVDAVLANLNSVDNVEATLSVYKEADDRVDKENTWNGVVDKFQEASDRAVKEGYDYLWIVEADVIIPPHALTHLLSMDADVACGVTPYHFQNYLNDPHFKGLCCTGYVKPNWANINLYLDEIRDKVLVGSKDKMIFNGTGCILIKTDVLKKIRWRWDNKVSGFDVYFWVDVQQADFKAVTDGYVVCEHLGN